MIGSITNNLYGLGRFLLGLYFLLPGLTKVFLFQENLDIAILREVPLPIISVMVVSIIQIICGFLLIIGKHTYISAVALAIVTLLINIYIHDFWNMAGEPNIEHEAQNFIKNLAIFGGLLVLSGKIERGKITSPTKNLA